MEITKIADEFSITGQIQPDQMAAIAGLGIRAIICCRPDNEAQGQPTFAAVQTAATAAGISMRHIPVDPKAMDKADFAAFAEALKTMPGPILGYCGSGKRAAAMYGAVTKPAT